MAKLDINAGTTSKTIDVLIYDSASTSGAGKTGLVYNTAGLTWYYHRDNSATAVPVTMATMTVGTWATGGFKEVDASNMPGVYQLGIPDAAIASGAKYVTMILKGASGMVPCALEIQLDQADMVGRQTVDSTYPATSIGKRLSALGDPDGTAQAGASSTITLAVTASNVDDYYTGQFIALATGTGSGQVRVISDYVGATKVATVSKAWKTNPDATTGYVLVPAGSPLDAICEDQGSYTAQQILSIVLAAVAGESPSNGTFKTPNGSATRIAGAVTSGGVRSTITLTPSAP